MTTARLVTILERLAGDGSDGSGTLRLCELSTELTGTSGASIMLLFDTSTHGSLCTSDGIAAYLDDLQYTLGVGPAIDAHHDGSVVSADDLSEPAGGRWPGLTQQALQAGVRAMFSFPIRIGAVRMGALTVYRHQTGPLTELQRNDGLLLADVAARTILAMQAEAPPGSVAVELESGANFHLVVHQAAGMASVQLDVSVAEALVRLRALAFRSGRSIDEVSRDVVDRRLRMPRPDKA